MEHRFFNPLKVPKKVAGDFEVSGSVTAGLPRVEKPATGSLSAAECRGKLVTNKGQTDNATVDLYDIFEGASLIVSIETTVDKYWRLKPKGSEVIRLNGDALTGGYYVGIASAAVGAKLVVFATYSGASLVWDITTIDGTWAAQA
jgi:hypothetical protein